MAVRAFQKAFVRVPDRMVLFAFSGTLCEADPAVCDSLMRCRQAAKTRDELTLKKTPECKRWVPNGVLHIPIRSLFFAAAGDADTWVCVSHTGGREAPESGRKNRFDDGTGLLVPGLRGSARQFPTAESSSRLRVRWILPFTCPSRKIGKP